MNSILYTNNNSPLTDEEKKAFKDAEKIVKNNQPKHKNYMVFLIIFISIFILAILSCTIFALININSTKIVRGVSVLNIDISNLTKDEAKEKLNTTLNDRLSTDIVLKHNIQNFTFVPTEIQCSYDIDNLINSAYAIGRGDNIIRNNFDILNSLFKSTTFTPTIIYNEELLKSIVPQMESNFEDAVVDPSYTIDGNNLTVLPGKDGNSVKYDELKTLILEKLLSPDYNTDSIEVPTEYTHCTNIDIDKIHSEIYKEATDAYFTKDPFTIHASATGLDFNISVDEAKSLITGDKDSYIIPLKTLYPKVATNDIDSEAFPDLLASFSTNYSSSNSNRSTNIALATAKINGIVLMPGETFSYNETVGKRTVSAGFKEAGVYVNGQVTTGIGGGICQVSSTLYNAVLRANLDIVDRTNHQFQVGYVPIGTDATVSWGAPDFKFKNSRSYPVKIVATTYNKNIYIKVFGLKEKTEYEVQIQSYRTSTIAYKTTYTTDSSLGAGKTKVIQAGSNGAKSETYKILKLNGEVVSKTLLSKDTYQPHNKIIAKGN